MRYTISDRPIVLREFGRNVQSMIEHAVTVEDRRERTKEAEEIVKIMLQLYSGMKDTMETKQYIWDSLFIISDFKLDVDSPFPVPERNAFLKNKTKVPYTNQKLAYAHFGKNVELGLNAAAEMPEGQARWDLIMQVAAFMRQCLEELDKEAYLEETISNYIFELSKGIIRIDPKDLVQTQAQIQAASSRITQKVKIGKANNNDTKKRGAYDNNGGRDRKPFKRRR